MLAVQFDVQTQLVLRVGVEDRLLIGNDAVVIQLEQRLIEGAHAEFPRLAHDLLQLVKFALQKLVRDDRRIEQNFDGGYASACRPPCAPGAAK